MKIILLSGGSGKRLWPLSNDARSKQFLRLLTAPDGTKESMIQRVVRQITSAGITDDIVVATGISQKDSIVSQLGPELSVVTEPCRRDTFPAILLACTYLASKGVQYDEPIVVMPCDTYTEDGYFTAIKRMSEAVTANVADIVLMGIHPTYPSSKYGYIVPGKPSAAKGVSIASRFVEKPTVKTAEELIGGGALWNGGVFAFRLGYVLNIAARIMPGTDFENIRNEYHKLPAISFDYEVVEKAASVAVTAYHGRWKDLGTWNTLTDELAEHTYGNVHGCPGDSTYIINELGLPLVCIGTHDLVVAASPDGILVSERRLCENLHRYVDGLGKRPMYEERRWGKYKVIDSEEFSDGYCALTKQLTLDPGKSISYQRHSCRDEVWTFINGEGEIVLDGKRRKVARGEVIFIAKGSLHALRATTSLTFIEVQQGTNLIEEDIERFPFDWDTNQEKQ